MNNLRDLIRQRVTENRPTALPPLPTRRVLRVAAGLSQTDVALVVGVDRATISRWETGDREPAGPNREAYADALDEMARAVTA